MSISEEEKQHLIRVHDYLDEVFESFKIVGYSFDGERVQMSKVPNERARDALEMQMRDFLRANEVPTPVAQVKVSDGDEDC